MDEVEKAPWAGAARSYAGWVPNVRSHLSFSVIGASRRADAYSRPYRDPPSRQVLALERRTSNDYPLPERLARWIWSDLTQHWLMEGVTRPTRIWHPTSDDPELTYDRQGMLLGRVHVLPHQDAERDRRIQDDAITAIRTELLLAPERPNDQELAALRDSIVDRAVAGSRNRLEVQFALLRTGELRLWFDERTTPLLIPDGAAPEDDLRKIAEQAYFFIKDVVHDHTHHDPSSDQITPLTEIDPAGADPNHVGEVAWRRETLWSLSREVERLNRGGGLVDQRRALGIIAYAQAFQQGLMGHIRDASGKNGFKAASSAYDYDFAHLKESIKASIDVVGTARTQTVQLTIAFVATLLSAISVVASLTSSHNGGMPRDDHGAPVGGIVFGHGDEFLRILAWNPFMTGGGIAILLLGILSATLADGEAGLFNRFQRVVSQLSRAISISLAYDSRKQVVIDWALHVLASVMALVASLLCLAVLTASFDV